LEQFGKSKKGGKTEIIVIVLDSKTKYLGFIKTNGKLSKQGE